jgi:hypothetical protein
VLEPKVFLRFRDSMRPITIRSVLFSYVGQIPLKAPSNLIWWTVLCLLEILFVLFLEVFLPLFYEKYYFRIWAPPETASFIWLEFQAYVVNESHCRFCLLFCGYF